MIIQASIDDIPRILECAIEYTNDIPGMEFNAEHYVAFWRSMLTSGAAAIFLSVDGEGRVKGGIGGIKYPQPLTGQLTAVEMFWYTKKDSRGDGVRLYKAFYYWAVESGCKKLAMIYLPCSMPDELHTFYTKQGFDLVEMHYERSLP